MTTNDFDRTARLWLAEGPTEMPDRALQQALDDIHVTSQRRTWWLTNPIRIAAVVGAVGLAVVGFQFLSLGGRPEGPAATPAATSAATPAATSRALTVDQTQLGPGTYVTADPFLLRVTFTLPAGWESAMGGPYFVNLKRPYLPGGVSFSIFDKVRADPCHPDQALLDPTPGPTVEDLAAALASLPGLDVTTPTDVTVDGYTGKQLTLTAPATFEGCTIYEDGYVIWELPLGGTKAMSPGERDRVWIVDAEGERLVIHTSEIPGQTSQDQAEVQGILDSIRIEPVNRPTPEPS